MNTRRMLFLSSVVLALGVVGLAAPNSAYASSSAAGGAVLCGPMCYEQCPGYAIMEEDCQTMGSNCHSSGSCYASYCGWGWQSDCGPA
jgi:hypothetical protein